MRKLIASPGRQLELRIPISQPDEVTGEIEQLLRHEMHDLPFPLNTAVDRHHRGAQHHPSALLKQGRPYDDVVAGPVSSSMVINMTPLADPGFCRTSTKPAV